MFSLLKSLFSTSSRKAPEAVPVINRGRVEQIMTRTRGAETERPRNAAVPPQPRSSAVTAPDPFQDLHGGDTEMKRIIEETLALGTEMDRREAELSKQTQLAQAEIAVIFDRPVVFRGEEFARDLKTTMESMGPPCIIGPITPDRLHFSVAGQNVASHGFEIEFHHGRGLDQNADLLRAGVSGETGSIIDKHQFLVIIRGWGPNRLMDSLAAERAIAHAVLAVGVKRVLGMAIGVCVTPGMVLFAPDQFDARVGQALRSEGFHLPYVKYIPTFGTSEKSEAPQIGWISLGMRSVAPYDIEMLPNGLGPEESLELVEAFALDFVRKGAHAFVDGQMIRLGGGKHFVLAIKRTGTHTPLPVLQLELQSDRSRTYH